MKGLVVLFLLLCIYGCSENDFLRKKTPHQAYAEKLTKSGLINTALGQQWINASKKALSKPQTITLPYSEAGYFPADNPRATGLQFSVRQGEKIVFTLTKNPTKNFLLFAELWRKTDAGKEELLIAADSTSLRFEHEVDKAENYILQIQPELLVTGSYTLSISVAPSLGFPVPGGQVGSFWGDDRDGGARRHEGIDIFAPKRTPVIAAANGTVTSVRQNGLGGKVVFMRPAGKNYSLYYAHLDEQLVTNGEKVGKGDTLGLVGTTGNAAGTPPHLHFGIYASGGAVNPFPFIDPKIKTAAEVKSMSVLFDNFVRIPTSISDDKKIPEGTIALPLAVASSAWRVELPNGEQIIIKSIPKKAANPLASIKVREAVVMTAYPIVGAPQIKKIEKESTVQVLGYYESFALITSGEIKGWVPSKIL